MSRKLTTSQAGAILILGVLGAILLTVVKLAEVLGSALPIVVALLVGGFVAVKVYRKRRRFSYLLEKYRDPALAKRVLDGYFWQGQTEDQLRDALGPPVAIDNHVLKTKTKQTWKYVRRGRNRFGLRVTVENGVVVGWDNKS